MSWFEVVFSSWKGWQEKLEKSWESRLRKTNLEEIFKLLSNPTHAPRQTSLSPLPVWPRAHSLALGQPSRQQRKNGPRPRLRAQSSPRGLQAYRLIFFPRRERKLTLSFLFPCPSLWIPGQVLCSGFGSIIVSLCSESTWWAKLTWCQRRLHSMPVPYLQHCGLATRLQKGGKNPRWA